MFAKDRQNPDVSSDQLVRDLAERLEKAEVQGQVRAAVQQTRQTIDLFNQDRLVDPKNLEEPITL